MTSIPGRARAAITAVPNTGGRDLLCTVGPATLARREIARLTELGVGLFRINLSHTSLSALPGTIEKIREYTDVPICLDTEGAQIRTGRLSAPLVVRDQSTLYVHAQPIVGDTGNLSFYPHGIIERIEPGDLISIDFNSVVVQVIDKTPQHLVTRVMNGGEIGQNKAVSLPDRSIILPTMTQKDREALEIGRRFGVRHIALSFAHRASDIDLVREVAGTDAFVIAKIECRTALENLDDIIARADALLIDRGDLSREVSIERIPAHQKAIIRIARRAGRRIYVATNLLESMIQSPTPTRAEVNDIYNTLLDGADGLVLAAETAIGKYPLECAAMVVRVLAEFERDRRRASEVLFDQSVSLLVPPHGGQAIESVKAWTGNSSYDATVSAHEATLLDCEFIANGAFSPLRGFMDRETLEGVLDRYRLPNGVIWPTPILLQASADSEIDAGQRIGLKDADGKVQAIVEVARVEEIDLCSVARRWFGTESSEHPGVQSLKKGGPRIISGQVLESRRGAAWSGYLQLTPAQTRSLFESKGWSRVVGFQTRNVILRLHEHIQMTAMEDAAADGLLVTPLYEPKDVGEWTMDIVVRSYQMMIDSGFYRRGKVIVAPMRTQRRHGGARDVVQEAIRRRNMGCSHVVIGRDEAQSNGHGKRRGARELFEQLGDLGITPIWVDALGWNPERRKFEAATAEQSEAMPRGSELRERIRRGVLLPEWLMRPEIQDMLRAATTDGAPVFAG